MMVGIALGASVLGAFFNIRAYERRRRREAEHGGGGDGEVRAGMRRPRAARDPCPQEHPACMLVFPGHSSSRSSQ